MWNLIVKEHVVLIVEEVTPLIQVTAVYIGIIICINIEPFVDLGTCTPNSNVIEELSTSCSQQLLADGQGMVPVEYFRYTNCWCSTMLVVLYEQHSTFHKILLHEN